MFPVDLLHVTPTAISLRVSPIRGAAPVAPAGVLARAPAPPRAGRRVSVGVGDKQFLGRELGEDLHAVRRDHYLFLNPGRRYAVGCRTVGFQGKDHALLDLDRRVQRREPADDRALVQGQAEAMPELQAERGLLVREADVLSGRPE